MNGLEQKYLSSRKVAEMVEKDHAHLMRDIRNYVELLSQSNFGSADYFKESTYTDAQGKERDFLYPAENPSGKEPRDNSAVNGDTAFPYSQDGKKIIFELWPGKSDIIDSRTDNPAGKCNQREIDDCALGEAGTLFFFRCKENSKSRPDHNQKTVPGHNTKKHPGIWDRKHLRSPFDL